MATYKSTSITNMDATPAVRSTGGIGAKARLHEYDEVITTTTLALGDVYKFVRLQSFSVLKRIDVNTHTQLDTNGVPTLKIDVGGYYSDSTVDGTTPANQGLKIGVGNELAAAVAFAHTVGGQTVDGMQGNALTNLQAPLWKALGLASDPGGFIDIAVTINTAAATANNGPVSVTVYFVGE